MRKVWSALGVTVFVILLMPSCRRARTPLPSALQDALPHFVPTPTVDPLVAQYESLLHYALEGQIFAYADNHRGRLAWNTAYFLDSLLNMFVATQDPRYLDLFVEHADALLALRDDFAGRSDFTGRARPGWQANAHYTLGRPYVLPDAAGRPSLRVQAIRLSGNDHTVVVVRPEDERHFTLEVQNDFRRAEPLKIRYEDLTLGTVEAVVNADLSPRHLIRVWRVGDAPPAAGRYELKETYAAVLHSEHTPAINIPLARFAALVYQRPDLASYRPAADTYVRRCRESYQDYADLWRTDDEGGYFVFDPRAPIWSAGFPVPYNGLALHGRFLLWLYNATGDAVYRTRAEALLQKILAGMTMTPEGYLRMPYWYGRPFHGWDGPQEGPAHHLYVRSAPFDASEDTSHFTLTLQFLLDAYEAGWLTDDAWAQAAVRTYTDVLWKPECHTADRSKFLAHNLEGQGCIAAYPAGVYARLSAFEPRIWDLSWTLYREAYSDPRAIAPDYEYGYVLLGWSLLALQRPATPDIRSGQ